MTSTSTIHPCYYHKTADYTPQHQSHPIPHHNQHYNQNQKYPNFIQFVLILYTNLVYFVGFVYGRGLLIMDSYRLRWNSIWILSNPVEGRLVLRLYRYRGLFGFLLAGTGLSIVGSLTDWGSLGRGWQKDNKIWYRKYTA